MTDDTPKSGAQFARDAGADPYKWAEACHAAIKAAHHAGETRSEDEAKAFLEVWFRDAMRAAVKASTE